MHTASTNKSWVLITGASSGFGEEFARQYAEQGHSLVLVARRLDRLQQISEALRQQFGIEVVVEQVDLSDISAVIQLHRVCWSEGTGSTEPSLKRVTYDFAPRLVMVANSATRLPRARAASNSFSSTPGESGPVVALAPKAPPPLTTLI